MLFVLHSPFIFIKDLHLDVFLNLTSFWLLFFKMESSLDFFLLSSYSSIVVLFTGLCNLRYLLIILSFLSFIMSAFFTILCIFIIFFPLQLTSKDLSINILVFEL